MRKLLKYSAMALVCICFSALSGFLAYKHEMAVADNSIFERESLEVKASTDNTVTENTVLDFVYNFNDGYSDTQEMLVPEYMYGWNRGQMSTAYRDWEMTEYSPTRIVFNKNVNSNSSQHYVLKAKDGYVTVFYRDSDVEKEKTSTPIASLSTAEREEIAKGINIDGDTELAKYLENIES